MRHLRPLAWVPPTLLAAVLTAGAFVWLAQAGHLAPADGFAYGVVGTYLWGALGCATVAHARVVRAEAHAADRDEEVRALRRMLRAQAAATRASGGHEGSA